MALFFFFLAKQVTDIPTMKRPALLDPAEDSAKKASIC